MAKEYKNATMICLILTALAAAGIAAGVYWTVPLVIISVMLPAVLYEIYRTEGLYTKLASVAMLLVLSIEAFLVFKKEPVKIAEYIKNTEDILKKSYLDIIDLTIAAPAFIAVLAFFLIRRTGGKYTIWLAVIILVTSIALIYTINPVLFHKLLNVGLEQGKEYVR